MSGSGMVSAYGAKQSRLDVCIAICNYVRVTASPVPSPDLAADPALDVAERQLVMLGEIARMSMEVASAYAASAIASARAAQAILDDKYFMPEIGRANACGAKDAAESYQKVTRSLRLTLMLETTVARAVSDLRAGVVAPAPAAASGPGATAARLVIEDGAAPSAPPAPALKTEREDEGIHLERPGGERERLCDIEQAERLPKGAYCRIVNDLAADIGATVDWETAAVSAPDIGDIVATAMPPVRTGVAGQDAARRGQWNEPPRRQECQGGRAERVASG